jgi:hypothetical protein
MQSKLGEANSRHAKTDLYDEVRGAFLIQYPYLFVILMALAGVIAFGLAGFLGYLAANSTLKHPVPAIPADAPFLQPWALFLWFCALMVTLLASIFRDESLRSRLIAMMVVAALSIVIVGTLYFSKILPDYRGRHLRLHQLPDHRRILGGYRATVDTSLSQPAAEPAGRYRLGLGAERL